MDPSKIFPGGAPFNIIEFLKQPVVILRIIAVLFAIIVFGCVSAGAHTNHGVCIYGGVKSACNYGVGIGVVAFLGAIAFLVCDAMFSAISNVKTRRKLVLGDLAFSGLWTFLWFVGFCFLTNKWTGTPEKWLDEHDVHTWQENNARSAIVFSLFSTGVWGGITFFALQRFRLGQAGIGVDGTATSANSDTPGGGMGPPSAYSSMPDNPHQMAGGPNQGAVPQQMSGTDGHYPYTLPNY